MKTPDWRETYLGEFDGFALTIEFNEEIMNARNHFIKECGWTEEQYNEIKDFYWFQSIVKAHKGVVHCGSAYLGGNCYASKNEALGDKYETLLSGYGPQLIKEAIECANANLNEVTQ